MKSVVLYYSPTGNEKTPDAPLVLEWDGPEKRLTGFVRYEVVDGGVSEALDAASPLPGETVLNSVPLGGDDERGCDEASGPDPKPTDSDRLSWLARSGAFDDLGTDRDLNERAGRFADSEEPGSEPTPYDYLQAIREMIDEAMRQ
jgi:hypothetical protein